MGGLFMKPTPHQDGLTGLQAIAFFATMAHGRASRSNQDLMLAVPHCHAGDAG